MRISLIQTGFADHNIWCGGFLPFVLFLLCTRVSLMIWNMSFLANLAILFYNTTALDNKSTRTRTLDRRTERERESWRGRKCRNIYYRDLTKYVARVENQSGKPFVIVVRAVEAVGLWKTPSELVSHCVIRTLHALQLHVKSQQSHH